MRILFGRSQRLMTAVVALSLSGAAQATSAFDYNVFAFGNFTSANTEVMGALAVGKNATFSSYGVGVSLPKGYTGDSLVVGGNLNASNGNLFAGNGVVGGTVTTSGFGTPGGTISAGAALPVDFVAELVRVKDISQNLAGLQGNGTVSTTGPLVFTGTDSVLNVFEITSVQLAAANGFTVNIPTGAAAVFNVSGETFTSSGWGSFILNGQTISNNVADKASPLLFNFSQATSLEFVGSWAGSVLAPDADVKIGWSGFFGSLIANNVNSSAEFYNVQFDEGRLPVATVPGGNIPPVPEPSSWVMMIGGMLALGAVLRRRKTVVSFA